MTTTPTAIKGAVVMHNTYTHIYIYTYMYVASGTRRANDRMNWPACARTLERGCIEARKEHGLRCIHSHTDVCNEPKALGTHPTVRVALCLPSEAIFFYILSSSSERRPANAVRCFHQNICSRTHRIRVLKPWSASREQASSKPCSGWYLADLFM